MSVQNSANNTSRPFILSSGPAATSLNTILQNGGRTAPLLENTLMAIDSATGKYVPLQSVVVTTGAAYPAGIYVGDDIPTADLIAGDVVDAPILVGEAFVDLAKIIFDSDGAGPVTLASIVANGTLSQKTILQLIQELSIYPQNTISTSSFEN